MTTFSEPVNERANPQPSLQDLVDLGSTPRQRAHTSDIDDDLIAQADNDEKEMTADDLDALIAKASRPSLSQLMRAGKKKGHIRPEFQYK